MTITREDVAEVFLFPARLWGFAVKKVFKVNVCVCVMPPLPPAGGA